jgi:hypothetical protein
VPALLVTVGHGFRHVLAVTDRTLNRLLDSHSRDAPRLEAFKPIHDASAPSVAPEPENGIVQFLGSVGTEQTRLDASAGVRLKGEVSQAGVLPNLARDFTELHQHLAGDCLPDELVRG